jgi:hypothetical protein
MNEGEASAPFAAKFMDECRDHPEFMFAFMQDHAYLRVLRHENDARFLHHTAAQAVWYAKHPFERMCLFASQTLAAGALRHERWYHSSRVRFDHAVNELGGSQEAVAIQTLDVARGAELIGDLDRAVDYAAIARHVAVSRREDLLQARAEAILLRMGVSRVDALPAMAGLVGLLADEGSRPE